ncbi:hypothetical protein [Paenisporosarcina quisquiliarum]|uniref:hypothetical protein n=1 Tax=Paenisporosarcina quisquiliarum TaxID=365346 RepID=UPI00373518C0
MRKNISTILTVFLVSSLLFGCHSEDNMALETEKPKPSSEIQVDDNNQLKLDGEITKIIISKTKGVNATVFEKDEVIETFMNIISGAIKESGIVNMANPDLYMDVVYENGNKQSFYLWIGEKGQKSTLMKTDDTHTIYTVSGEMNDMVIELVESIEN